MGDFHPTEFHGLNVSLPDSYVEALTSNMMVLEGAFGRKRGLDVVMRVGPT